MHTECSDILTELESWYAGERGEYLMAAIRAAISGVLDTTFGYHILQLGVHGREPLCEGSPINHRILCAERCGPGIGLVAHCDELPLESDSVDAVISHHCLEFAHNPHQALREMQRVLRPHGQMLIVGINPYSLLGAGAQARRLARHALWRHHRPVSELRLTDWLHLLGCEVQESMHLYGVPPVGAGGLRRMLARCDAWTARHNLPLGGLYVLHARKQVAAVNRSRRALRKGRLIGLVPKPSPTPAPVSPAPQRFKSLEKGDVAA